MIIEGIKNLLGEDLTKQVEKALKGKGKDGKGQKYCDSALYRPRQCATDIL